MIFDTLKDKYNFYRDLTDYKLLPNSYIMMMLDGRSFSKFIKKRFVQPFDEDFIRMMNDTAIYLCEKISGVKFAYVQSDEITLVIKDSPESGSFFSNRLCKLISIGASLASSKFNREFTKYVLNNKYKSLTGDIGDIDEVPLVEFDCKAWNLPNVNDVVASILYRQIDCIRNSKQQAAQTYLSHKILMKKDTDEQIKMLLEENGIDWNNYDGGMKFGRGIFKESSHHTKTITKSDGTQNTFEFIRNDWVARPMEELTNEESRVKLIEIL